MKLLLIEDDASVRDMMLKYLKREGYVCEQAESYKEGFKKINNYEYDCALVDLNLPGGDGMKLVRMLREENPDMGIVITSARDSTEDKIAGLETGADDYLSKPFNLSELNARIKAVMRRKGEAYRREMQYGPLTIRLEERTVLADGRPISLTKKEFDILVYLARNKNRVVTKDSIAEHLWGDYMDEAASFDFIYAHVKNLRKKLAEHGCGDLLKTIYGIGYKFVSG